MEQETGGTKVHLVHGTWANGLLKPQQAWFDRGSTVYERLRNCVPPDAEIESFRWSGRNNISSRAEAAESFAQYLESSIAQHPHSEHIIVAHSHGGTVAAHALARLSEKAQALSKIKGLVCLATPFVYLVKPTFAQLSTGLLTLTALLNALLWSGLMAITPSTLINLSILTLTALVATTATVVLIPVMILVASVSNKFESQFSRKMVTDVPIFQLRATRDEASLALGLMQSFNWLLSAFAANSDRPQGTLRNPVNWLKHLIGLIACSLIGYWLMKRFESQLGMELSGDMRFLIGQFIYAPAVAGAAYFIGYCLLAMAVGHTKVHEWLATSIEVDAAPPDVFCQLKIYTTLSTSSDSLRHGLYEHDDVIKDVGVIVSKLSSKT